MTFLRSSREDSSFRMVLRPLLVIFMLATSLHMMQKMADKGMRTM